MADWRKSGNPTYSYTYKVRKRRCKADWAGVGIGDAFKNGLDYYQRLPAQRTFYRLAAKAQKRVAENTGAITPEALRSRAEPQLSPCYTNYPPNLAAHSAIGLTAYLEFTSRCPHPLLMADMAEYLRDPARVDEVAVDPDVYQRTAHLVAHTVQQRLVLEELSRTCRLPAVELYRLFSASQQKLKLRTLKEILEAVILFGDVLPPWDSLEIHPTTRAMLRDLERVSRGVQEDLTAISPQGFLGLGRFWVRRLCRVLLPYLPLPPKGREQAPPSPDDRTSPRFLRQPSENGPPRRLSHPDSPARAPEFIEPLEGPAPPSLWRAGNAADHAANQLRRADGGKTNHGGSWSDLAGPASKTLAEFGRTMQEAGGQKRDWEDLRSEIVESILEQSSFEEGPITGSPTDGNEVQMAFPGGKQAGGEIFDRPLELSEDLAAVEQLRGEARPVTEQLRRNLYPNLTHLPESLRLRTGGALDGGRLALAEFCPSVFKRVRNVEVADRRGRPVLVIACDGSGSLERSQMHMLKILATAWLESIAGSEIQLLAGLYHSGAVRLGVTGPLVEWIYHPHKTPALGLADAVRAVASLPERGAGVQSDALSLAYIMTEARHLARGGMIYLIILSDTAWNRSFRAEMDGKAEVAALLGTLREEMEHKLHAMLVALGQKNTSGLEELLDKVIPVSPGDLDDPAAVAQRVGEYVSSCLRRHRRRRQSC